MRNKQLFNEQINKSKYSMNNSTQMVRLKKNTFAFSIIMICCQAGMTVAYSLGFSVKTSLPNISSIINAVLLAILVVAGFGLVFSYIRRLVWSGVGFTFFITAFCIQYYPIINNFWTRTAIDYNTTSMGFQNNTFSLYLANAGLPSAQLYGNCMTNALKCALAVAIAFSSILGRAGPLECLITVLFGAAGYQLNRQVVANLSVDGFGTYTIFTFAGFMGLALGLILKYKQNKREDTSTQSHQYNVGSDFSAVYSLFGSLIIFALFPVLAYEIDVTNNFNIFNLRNGPTSIVIGMGAGVVGSFCLSALIHGNIIIRDIIHGPIAGGIVVGSASFFITNPVYALVAGFAAGAVQSTIQSIEKYFLRNKGVVSTVSWTLFGVQGIIGGVFATGYKAIIDSHTNGFTYTNASTNFNPGYQLLIAIISAGIGLGSGILASTIIYCVSKHRQENHFNDKTYWHTDNGINYPKIKEVKQKAKPSPTPVNPDTKIHSQVVQPQPQPQPGPLPQPQPQPYHQPQQPDRESVSSVVHPDIGDISEFEFEMQFSEPSEAQGYYHAYL